MNIPASAEPGAFRSAYAWYQTVLMAWYECRGFRYASQSVEPYGIETKFTDMVFRTPEKDKIAVDALTVFGANEMAAIAAAKAPALFGDGTAYDLVESPDLAAGAHLADTDNNRKLVEDLFRADFPGAIIAEFSSQTYAKGRALRFRALIPFDDLYAWAESIQKGES